MGLAGIVHFVGMISDRGRFFDDLDVHVSIAVGDDVGLATLESASTATPSFAQQIIRGGNCLDKPVPTRESPSDLALLIWRMAATAEQRQILGTQQAQYVRSERSVARMVAAYGDVYLACLQRARNGRCF